MIDSFVPTPNVLLRGDGSLWVTPKSDALASARAVLEEMQEAVARTIRVEMQIVAGDEIVPRLEVPALVGRTAFLRFGREQAIIPDVDVEVG